MPEIESRSARRAMLEHDLRESSESLAAFSAGAPLEAFIDSALHEDADQLKIVIEALREELQQTNSQLDAVHQMIGAEENERKKMNGSAAAAEAEENVQQIAAQIRSEAEQYARLRLSAIVLQGAIERYREQNQDPVLARASDLFAELTLGAFEELRPDFAESSQTVLLGVRAGGNRTVDLQGMSDGTRDQLYLALRIASLEHYLERHPPLPFIVDDILLAFDDERAAAALRILGRLSERTQVIFFTHHQHLVDLAQSELSDETLFVHRLERASTALQATR